MSLGAVKFGGVWEFARKGLFALRGKSGCRSGGCLGGFPDGRRWGMFEVLRAIELHPGVTVRGVVRRLGRGRRTVVAVVAWLEREGLVERDSSLWRKARLRLTGKGREVLEQGFFEQGVGEERKKGGEVGARAPSGAGGDRLEPTFWEGLKAVLRHPETKRAVRIFFRESAGFCWLKRQLILWRARQESNLGPRDYESHYCAISTSAIITVNQCQLSSETEAYV